jgi:hypothetical protein
MQETCKEEQRGKDKDSFEYHVSIPILSDRIRMRCDVQTVSECDVMCNLRTLPVFIWILFNL